MRTVMLIASSAVLLGLVFWLAPMETRAECKPRGGSVENLFFPSQSEACRALH